MFLVEGRRFVVVESMEYLNLVLRHVLFGVFVSLLMFIQIISNCGFLASHSKVCTFFITDVWDCRCTVQVAPTVFSYVSDIFFARMTTDPIILCQILFASNQFMPKRHWRP